MIEVKIQHAYSLHMVFKKKHSERIVIRRIRQTLLVGLRECEDPRVGSLLTKGVTLSHVHKVMANNSLYSVPTHSPFRIHMLCRSLQDQITKYTFTFLFHSCKHVITTMIAKHTRKRV